MFLICGIMYYVDFEKWPHKKKLYSLDTKYLLYTYIYILDIRFS